MELEGELSTNVSLKATKKFALYDISTLFASVPNDNDKKYSYYVSSNESNRKERIEVLYMCGEGHEDNYIKLTDYFSRLILPFTVQQESLFFITDNISILTLCDMVKNYIMGYAEGMVDFWYKKSIWYFLLDNSEMEYEVKFISSLSVDHFIVKIESLGGKKYKISVKFVMGFMKNYVYFFNKMNEMINPKFWGEKDMAINNDKYIDILWRKLFQMMLTDKFGYLKYYLDSGLERYDSMNSLFGVFLLNILVQYNFDETTQYILNNMSIVASVMCIAKCELKLQKFYYLAERAVFSIYILSHYKEVTEFVMHDIEFVKMVKDIALNDYVPKIMVPLKNDCMKIIERINNYLKMFSTELLASSS